MPVKASQPHPGKLHYAWVMVIISALLMLVQALRMFSFGIFLIPITAEFGWGRGELSGAYSLALLVSGFLSIISGRLCDKCGPRLLVTGAGLCIAAGFILMSRIHSIWQVQVVWGLFMGAGSSFFFIPVTSTIARWFAKRRGLAISLSTAGFSLGGVITAPLCQHLIDSYGWRNAYLIMSAIALAVSLPLAHFLKHSPERAGCQPYGAEQEQTSAAGESKAIRDFTLRRAVHSRRFWLVGFMEFGFFASLQVVLVHITPYALDSGIPAFAAASIVSFISVFSTIGRVATGFLADKFGGRLMLVVCLATGTAALFWLFFTGPVWTFYVFAVVFGLAYGGIVPLTSIVPVDLFGLASFGVIFAGLNLISITGEAMGAPAAGFIFDVTGSYRMAIILCVVIDAAATLLGVLILREGRRDEVSRQAPHS